MAQTGFTPIQIYYSTTTTNVPTAGNLADGELAINTADGKLFYKDNLGSVQVIASKASASGDVAGPASATDNAVVRFDGTTGKLVQNSAVTIADTTGDITGGAYNKLTITPPATSATLTIANGKTLTANNSLTLAGTDGTTMTFPTVSSSIGYLNIPLSGSAKTSSYILATSDVGEYIEVGSGGSITIPNSTFAAGDVVSIFNNTTGGITITCSITTAYIAGTDADKASVTLATRGIATVLFISGTVCVITGNVT